MKTYFRLLSFARPIGKFAFPYVLFTVLSVIFNTLNLALLAPLVTTLFSARTATGTLTRPDRWTDVLGYFNYTAQEVNRAFGIYAALQLVCAVIVVSVLLSNLFRYFSQRIIESLRIHTLLNLRKAVFESVMDMHTGYFSSERKGDIISKVTTDVQAVQFSVTGTLQVVFKEPFQLVAYMVTLLAISVKLTLFSLLIIPVSAWLIARLVKSLKNEASRAQSSFGTLVSQLEEALTGIKMIKAFNSTRFIKDKFHRENEKFSDFGRRISRRQQLASPVSEFLGVTMIAVIVLYGGQLVVSGGQPGFTAEKFITYIAIFSQVIRPAKALTDAFTNISMGIASGERVLEMIDQQPLVADSPAAVSITGFNGSIDLSAVSFSYGNAEVLKDIHLRIRKGEMIALVGPSGGGKSTLMDLVPRFMDVQSGCIEVDGRDIRDVKIESLRSLMGIVSQETILFNDTIFNNIAFGLPGMAAHAVEEAARIANAHDFIMGTEHAYQTIIGDRGMKLSGGQKQRICIARAVLRNPPLLLLDEATSALDTRSERLVQDALNKLMQSRTALVIAHRLSTVKNADRIVVIEAGRIVEEGTHHELMHRNGVYRKLVRLQEFTDDQPLAAPVAATLN
ncbi:ABC transporter ATP-binding protein [Hufsiella ginkgonis]|uniref:ATP-binding cassette domain-containing protein n=1 Tax=Hufsiella ginkgonis TaxID=2695274 RepID=A0A7K1XXC0_9SPHI|nr:ABC transporter ATP-binding protein [Hufsiella ginkgonis]MXV15640.1 ATP-binding cassette domain-containing protein [Hufsiella ginkgonis]